MLQSIFTQLLTLDVKTMMSVLFWGNLISVLLVFSYQVSNPHAQDKEHATNIMLAKGFQAVAFFLLFFRHEIPDFFSVNIGNSFLFIGCYWEAMSLFYIVQDAKPIYKNITKYITVFSIVTFNLAEIIAPHSSTRVALATFGVFFILLVPTIRLAVSAKISNFKRIVGAFYFLFLFLLLPRAVQALTTQMSILSNTFIQTLMFISMILLMIYSLSSYLLLMKQDSDLHLKQMATTDMLTGVLNRNGFLDTATRQFTRHSTGRGSLGLLFVDIDHFKKVNDNYGHAFGDIVLAGFADVIKKSLRADDLACRFGGEEFLVFLPRSDAVAVKSVAARIVAGVAALSFDEQPGFSFTVSIGIRAGIPNQSDTLDTWISQADTALYASKENGRNRTFVYKDGHCLLVAA